MPILDAVRKFLEALRRFFETSPAQPPRTQSEDDARFLEEVFGLFPFTPQAQQWLRQNVRFEVIDLQNTTGGGGGWYPGQRMVRLNTAQYEAAIHELAHALWHDRREDRTVRDGLVAAVHRLAEDGDPRWSRVRTPAGHYIHGIPTQPGFEHGMLLPQNEWGTGGGPQGEWNDWEMFAGLASGCMADIRLLPPYVRQFYSDIFVELPEGVPAPEEGAPHR
jgi:hypothetical protein